MAGDPLEQPVPARHPRGRHRHLPLLFVILSQAPLAAFLLIDGPGAMAALALWAATQFWILISLLSPRGRLFGAALHRAPAQPRIALTFDDGPHEDDTPAILEILRRHDVRATFFFIGDRARRHPDLVRRVAAEGHEVGAHSQTHPWWFSMAGPRRLTEEIERPRATLEPLIGRPVRWFRSPMGHRNLFLRAALDRADLGLAGWSVRPFDTIGRRAEAIAAAVLRGAAPGGIILLHEGVRRKPGAASPTRAALEPILKGLRARGLEPVRLQDLRGIPEPGPAPRRAGPGGSERDAVRAEGRG